MNFIQNLRHVFLFFIQRNIFLAVFVSFLYYMSVNHYQVTAKMLNNLMPTNFEYWATLAQNQEAPDINQLKQSKKYYQKLIKLFSDDTASMNLLAFIYFYSGDLEMAKKLYQESARINSRYFGTHYNLGLIYFLQKDYVQAELSFKKCLVGSLAVASEFIYSSRAYLPIRKSIPQFETFIQKKISQENSWASSMLAVSVYLRNFPAIAQGQFQVDSNLEFQDFLYFRLGQEALYFKQYSTAVYFFQESLNKNPEYLPALHGLGVSLQTLGKSDVAAKIFYKEKVLRKTSKKSSVKEAFLNPQVF